MDDFERKKYFGSKKKILLKKFQVLRSVSPSYPPPPKKKTKLILGTLTNVDQYLYYLSSEIVQISG